MPANAIETLDSLFRSLPLAARSLKEMGMEEKDIDLAADRAMEEWQDTKKSYSNPRHLRREGVREVIRRAWSGEKARLQGLE